MVYVNQLKLIKKGVEPNKKFLELMYNNNKLVDVEKRFDFLDCKVSIRRQLNLDMTLDKFLEGVNDKSYVTLLINSPTPFEIRYGIVNFNERDEFVWVNCPYNLHNFDIVSRLYEESFKTKLEDEPAQKGILEYYLARII